MRPVAHYSRRGIDALTAGETTDCESIDLAPVCILCDGARWIVNVRRGSGVEAIPAFENSHDAERCPECNREDPQQCDYCGDFASTFDVGANVAGIPSRACGACIPQSDARIESVTRIVVEAMRLAKVRPRVVDTVGYEAVETRRAG